MLLPSERPRHLKYLYYYLTPGCTAVQCYVNKISHDLVCASNPLPKEQKKYLIMILCAWVYNNSPELTLYIAKVRKPCHVSTAANAGTFLGTTSSCYNSYWVGKEQVIDLFLSVQRISWLGCDIPVTTTFITLQVMRSTHSSTRTPWCSMLWIYVKIWSLHLQVYNLKCWI